MAACANKAQSLENGTLAFMMCEVNIPMCLHACQHHVSEYDQNKDNGIHLNRVTDL